MLDGIVTALAQSKDALQAVFAAVGSIVAIWGLTTWRRQLKGNTEYELARRLLRCVYRIRDRVDALREPFVSIGEMCEAARASLESKEELQKALGAADTNRLSRFAYVKRWEQVQEARLELEVEELEAEVLWHERVTPSLEHLHKSITTLGNALEIYLKNRTEVLAGANKDAFEETQRIVMRPLALNGETKDKFADDFRARITEIKEAVRCFLTI